MVIGIRFDQYGSSLNIVLVVGCIGVVQVGIIHVGVVQVDKVATVTQT